MAKKQTVLARNEARQHCAGGVMLRYSKHEGKGLSAPILREPQDDSALLYDPIYPPTVIARNEAISELRQSGIRNSVVKIFLCAFLLLMGLFSTNTWSQVKETPKRD